MRVVKKGWKKRPRVWKKEIGCKPEKLSCLTDKPACGATLEIFEADLILLYYKGEFGGKHYYAGVKCRCCGKTDSVGKVPDDIWRRLLKKPERFDGWQEAT